MTITNATLRTRVAEDLRIKSVDMDLDDADADRIDRRIASAQSYLRELGLIWWDDDAIPEHCEDAMSMVVCAMSCVAFGKIGQGYEAGLASGVALLKSIKPSTNVETLRTTYY
jgi:hypothetical protein